MSPPTPKMGYTPAGAPKRHAVLVSRRTLLGGALLLLVIYALSNRSSNKPSSIQLKAAGGEIPFIVDSDSAKLDRVAIPGIGGGAARPHPPSHHAAGAFRGEDDEEVVIGRPNSGSNRRPKEFGRPAGDGPVRAAGSRPKPIAAPLAADEFREPPRGGRRPPLPMANIEGEERPMAPPLPAKKPTKTTLDDAYEARVLAHAASSHDEESDDPFRPVGEEGSKTLLELDEEDSQGQSEHAHKAGQVIHSEELEDELEQDSEGAPPTIPVAGSGSRKKPTAYEAKLAALAKAKQAAKADKGSQYAAGTTEDDEVEPFSEEGDGGDGRLEEEDLPEPSLDEEIDDFFDSDDNDKSKALLKAQTPAKPKTPPKKAIVFGSGEEDEEAAVAGGEIEEPLDSASQHALDEEDTSWKKTRPQSGPYGGMSQPPEANEEEEESVVEKEEDPHKVHEHEFAQVESFATKVHPAADPKAAIAKDKFVKDITDGKNDALEQLDEPAEVDPDELEDEAEAVEGGAKGSSDGEAGEWADE